MRGLAEAAQLGYRNECLHAIEIDLHLHSPRPIAVEKLMPQTQ